MTLEILGCRLDTIDADEATERIFEYVSENAHAQVVTLGTEMVVYAQRDPAFRAVVNTAGSRSAIPWDCSPSRAVVARRCANA